MCLKLNDVIERVPAIMSGVISSASAPQIMFPHPCLPVSGPATHTATPALTPCRQARTSDVVGSLLSLAPKTATLLHLDPNTGAVLGAEEIGAELLQVGGGVWGLRVSGWIQAGLGLCWDLGVWV